jgi:hypothetical protein
MTHFYYAQRGWECSFGPLQVSQVRFNTEDPASGEPCFKITHGMVISGSATHTGSAVANHRTHGFAKDVSEPEVHLKI